MEEDSSLDMFHMEEVSTIVVGEMDVEVDEAPRKGPRIPLDHSCKVCGAPASAYLHYGAIVCYSCRAFFRRAIRKNFVCRVGDYSCVMEGTRSNRCRGCRYRKCLQVGMKPEMVDAMLKRNPDGGKRRRKAETTVGKVNTQPVFSRATDVVESVQPSSVETDTTSAECQKFYVYNKSTQTYEPITIISVEDEGVGTETSNEYLVNAKRGGVSSEKENQDDMIIIRAINSNTLQALNLNTDFAVVREVTGDLEDGEEGEEGEEEEWIDNIVTDHEEIVHTQTTSDTLQLDTATTTITRRPADQGTTHTTLSRIATVNQSPTLARMSTDNKTTTTVLTRLPADQTAVLTRIPADLVVCDISDSEVIQEEVIDSN